MPTLTVAAGSGLTGRHTRADLIRSVVEGVAYGQKGCLEIVEGLGVPADSVRASGSSRGPQHFLAPDSG